MNAGNVTCETHTTTTTGPNGSSETRQHYALIDGIDRLSDTWIIEQCDVLQTSNGTIVPQVPGCHGAANCVDSGAQPPTAPLCLVTFRGGTFTADGKLNIFCGFGTASRDTNGTLTSESDFRYQTVRLHR